MRKDRDRNWIEVGRVGQRWAEAEERNRHGGKKQGNEVDRGGGEDWS